MYSFNDSLDIYCGLILPKVVLIFLWNFLYFIFFMIEKQGIININSYSNIMPL